MCTSLVHMELECPRSMMLHHIKQQTTTFRNNYLTDTMTDGKNEANDEST